MSILAPLYEISNRQIEIAKSFEFRNVIPKLNPDARLNLILGLKGIGKTTYLLHHLNQVLKNKSQGLYISLDDFFFLEYNLMDVVKDFHQTGGEYLYIDEVHYYKNWDRAVKLIYDRYPTLKLMVTGSSAINIYKSKADLSRRGHFFYMPGLSFIEYLYYRHEVEKISPQSLTKLLAPDNEIVKKLAQKPGILKHFHDYLKHGYFPFSLDQNINIEQQLKQLMETTIDIDLNLVGRYSIHERRQVLALLRHLAVSTPYELNVSRIASNIGTDRNKLMLILDHLEQADLLHKVNLPSSTKGSMSKPDKIYLNNSNLYYALHPKGANIGSMREAFAYNQLIQKYEDVKLHQTADLIVADKYVLEIGGSNKSRKQIKGLKNAFILADNIDTSFQNYRPLWILGLLY